MMQQADHIRVRIVGATDVGLVREHNEDNFLIVDLDSGETDFLHQREYDLGERGAMLVVCDGMGGAAAGEVASHMAVESMRRQLLPQHDPALGEPVGVAAALAVAPAPVQVVTPAAGPAAVATLSASSSPEADVAPAAAGADPDSATTGERTPVAVAALKSPGTAPAKLELQAVARRLRDATVRANQEIYDAASVDITKTGMGTTLTALILLRDQVVVAQVGDSRAYLCRQGKLTQITHDQSLVNQLLDSGQITPEQAKLFEHSNVILQALGVQEDIEVVLSTETLRRGDRMLLCSDGLVGVVSDEEIQEVLTSCDDIEAAVHKLIDMARAGGGPDNITVIVAQAMGEGLVAPAAEDLVAYRVMTLEGDRLPERRNWPAEYNLTGAVSPGRETGPASTHTGKFFSPVTLLSMAAVLALLVTCLVVVMVLYPKRPPRIDQVPAVVRCHLTTEPAGLSVMVDERRIGGSQAAGVEADLPVGDHRVWLAKDGAAQTAVVPLRAILGQPCEAVLRVMVDAAVSQDASSIRAVADGGQVADMVPLFDQSVPAARDAALPAPADLGPNPAETSDAVGSNGTAGDPEANPAGKPKRSKGKRKIRDKAGSEVPSIALPTETPGTTPDMSTPAAVPPPSGSETPVSNPPAETPTPTVPVEKAPAVPVAPGPVVSPKPAASNPAETAKASSSTSLNVATP